MLKGDRCARGQKLYDSLESQFWIGVPNVEGTLSNRPGLPTKVFPRRQLHEQSKLNLRVRELPVLMKRCNCECGFFRHIEIAKQIDDVGDYRTSSRFTPDGKVILRYAEELTMNATPGMPLARVMC
jgi:hypothetical protein